MTAPVAAAHLTPDATIADHGRFVNIARYLRANGWTPTCTTWDGWREYRWTRNDVAVLMQPTPSDWQIAVTRPGVDDFISLPTSAQQAIDYLVTAGILPREFHSLYVPLPQRDPHAICPLCPDDLVSVVAS